MLANGADFVKQYIPTEMIANGADFVKQCISKDLPVGAELFKQSLERAKAAFEKAEPSKWLELLGPTISDPVGDVSGAGAISALAAKIIESAPLVSVNRTRSRQISERVQSLEPAVNELLRSRPEKLMERPLESYIKCILRAGELIDASNHGGWFKRAKVDGDDFDELVKRFEDIQQDLQLALGTELCAALGYLQDNVDKELAPQGVVYITKKLPSNGPDPFKEILDKAKSACEELEPCKWVELVCETLNIAGQAGALFGTGAVSTLAKKIMETASLVSVNKKNCLQLAERLKSMEPVVNELKSRPGKLIGKPLERYVKCIVRAGELIDASNHRTKWARFLNAKGDCAEFEKLFDLIKDTQQDLQLALGAEQGTVLRAIKDNAQKDSAARDQIGFKVGVVDEKLDSMYIDMKHEFQNLYEKLARASQTGMSTDSRSNKRNMERLWKCAMEDGNLNAKEQHALHSTAGAFDISDGEEKEIIRAALDSLRDKLAPAAIASLEVQIKEYHSFKKLQRTDSATVRFIPFEELVIREQVGRGGFGEVFRAEWHMADVACKMLLDQNPPEEAVADFKKELKLYSTLSHPCVVTMHGACMDSGKMSIVTEFMRGGSLYDKLRRTGGPLKREEAIGIAEDIAKGMSYLSSRGVIHRDLKSGNVLLTQDGNAKLSDFGLSRMKCETSTLARHVGTAAWMAPELFEDSPIYSEASDVYAFGVVIWEILTGKKPFEGRNQAQIARLTEQGKRPPVDGLDQTDAFVGLMKRCWDQNRQSRPSFQQVSMELRKMHAAPLQVLFTVAQQEGPSPTASVPSLTSQKSSDDYDIFASTPSTTGTSTSSSSSPSGVLANIQRLNALALTKATGSPVQKSPSSVLANTPKINVVSLAKAAGPPVQEVNSPKLRAPEPPKIPSSRNLSTLRRMKANMDDAPALERGCKELGELAEVDDSNQTNIADAGGIIVILDAMKQHALVAGVQEGGCAALANVARGNDANGVSIAEAGGINVILNGMRQHPTVPGVQQMGSAALGNMAVSNDANRVAIAKAGGLNVILDAIRRHASVPGVQVEGCAALRNLGNNDANRVSIAEAGGIPVILEAMKRRASVAGVHEMGCAALGNIAVSNEANRVSIAKAGGIAVILDSMRRRGSVPGVQEMGCAALGNIAVSNDANRVSIVEAGGIPTILESMRQHALVSGVQENGCASLGSIALNVDANRVAIVAAGGIKTIIDAMRKHASVPGVQKNGCAALGNVASGNDANKKAIAAAGGIVVILDAMRKHPAVSNLQEEGCAALANLARQNDANRTSIAVAGGITTILDSMTRHASVSDVQEQGCAALRNIGNNEANRVSIAAAGGIKVILYAMRKHISVSYVQEQGCGALRNVVMDNVANKVSIAAEGGITTILDAMRKHASVASVQEQGCSALRYVASGNDANKASIAAAGGIAVILDAMKRHAVVASLQQEGFAALSCVNPSQQPSH